MRGYRDDARPACASCGVAFVADDLALDENGRPRCASCGAAATTAVLDARADEARVAARRSRRWMLAGGLVVALLVALFVGRMIRASREEAAQHRAEVAAEIEMDARLEGVLATLNRAPDADAKRCDDDRIASVARMDGELWRGALKFRGATSWQKGEASRALRIDEASDAPGAARALREARLLVVLLDRFDDRTLGDAWRGTLYVFDLETSRALCWAPVRVAADEARGNVGVDTLLRRAANSALGAISKTLSLRE